MLPIKACGGIQKFLTNDILKQVTRTQLHTSIQSQVIRANMSITDLEFAYAPVRDQVRDLREYL
jgi:hypothetical protein